MVGRIGAKASPEFKDGKHVIVDFRTMLAKAVETAQAPGAVACVGTLEKNLFLDAVGQRQLIPHSLPAEKDTLYDLASLTKVIAAATSIMQLRDAGALDLDQPVSEFVPVPAFQAFTIRHLLSHTSGLPAGRPWYREVTNTNEMVQRIATLQPGWTPGTRHLYSDLGYILLGKIVELAAADSLDAYCSKHIFKPLEMNQTTFRPPEAWRAQCAATERCSWRNRVILGEVHDENAWAMGGVSGHAGLFSTAGDLAHFCRGLLTGRLLASKTLEEMIRFGQTPCFPWQGLGWKIDPWMDSIEGYLPSRLAFGHTGWTGTSMWLDHASGNFAILLSNTCHPSREKRYNRPLRRIFYTGTAARLNPHSSNAHTGLDRIVWDRYEALAGKRIALLTNRAAVDSLGRSILDVLKLRPDIEIKRIYSPEHGLEVRAEAGEAVPSKPGDSIPVTSLYGGQKQPTREELRNIQLFVVDLPDIGARYYTYMATMKDCMSACAESGIPMLVLDRPNPLGGRLLEGTMPEITGSPVCSAKIPVRHGMTLGELAHFFAKTEFTDRKLEVGVCAAGNWPRELMYPDCALPWVPPSPNIPTADAALVYIGTCLLEGVNINEGRGTPAPFQLVGAPWLKPGPLIDILEPETFTGLALKTASFTPVSLPGKASHPRYQDQPCQGLHIQVADPGSARPFAFAVALLCAIHRQHSGELVFEKNFDVLAGGPWLRKQIQAGAPVREIIPALSPALDDFERTRPTLYPTLDEMIHREGLVVNKVP